MEPDFWHQKWKSGEIGFHYDAVHPMLERHIAGLGLSAGARVFLPLCGKTGDIDWLLGAGFRVAGAELSADAVGQLFERLGVVPEVSDVGPLKLFQGPQIDVFVGDIFEVTSQALGPVEAVYDRAAMVALPAEMRGRYAAHLAEITDKAPQLLITFNYDETTVSGPPFSVREAEIARHYDGRLAVSQLERTFVGGGPKGVDPTDEVAWLLR